jgi:signal peptidase II
VRRWFLPWYRESRFYWVIGVTLTILLLDKITKTIIKETFSFHDVVVVIPGFFQIVRVHNSGGAFGILRDLPTHFTTPFFLGVGIIALLVLFHLLKTTPKEERGSLIALSAILGGAIGNLTDRIVQGYVVDFLDFFVGKYHWPAFNVADSAITCGVLYLLVVSFFKKEKTG